MSPIAKYFDREALSGEELSMMAELRSRVGPAAASHPPAAAWLTDITLLRYLRARQMNLDRAEEMLRATIDWRIHAKPEQTKWADVQGEASTGKMFVLEGKDRTGRPVLVMRPRNENTKDHDGQIRNLVYMLETASHLADQDGTVQLTILMDFEGYSVRTAPPMKTTKETLSILQNHYPERLGRSMMFRAPTMFSLFWKAISPFIDPVTYRKIVFIGKGSAETVEMSEAFNMATMEAAFGGSGPVAFEQAAYAKRMAVLDSARSTVRTSSVAAS